MEQILLGKGNRIGSYGSGLGSGTGGSRGEGKERGGQEREYGER